MVMINSEDFAWLWRQMTDGTNAALFFHAAVEFGLRQSVPSKDGSSNMGAPLVWRESGIPRAHPLDCLSPFQPYLF
jgi:hypothetical protein